MALVGVLAGCGGASPAQSTPSQSHASQSTPSTSAGSEGVEPHHDAARTDTTEAGPSADLADYTRRTMAIVRRHWTVPPIDPEQARTLSVGIAIDIDEASRRATGFHIVSESGHEALDTSVRRALAALVDASTIMPEPPVGLDDRSRVRLRLVPR